MCPGAGVTFWVYGWAATVRASWCMWLLWLCCYFCPCYCLWCFPGLLLCYWLGECSFQYHFNRGTYSRLLLIVSSAGRRARPRLLARLIYIPCPPRSRVCRATPSRIHVLPVRGSVELRQSRIHVQTLRTKLKDRYEDSYPSGWQ